MKHSKYIIGNWKMNPLRMKEAIDLLSGIESNMEDIKEELFVGVAAPFLFLSDLDNISSYISIGAQDVFWEDKTGAYTGEISAGQLKTTGSDFVIIGHSERRTYMNESDKDINKKVKSALSSGLNVVLCVGEPVQVREKGISDVKKYIKNQLDVDLSSSHNAKLLKEDKLIIAYEPLWAISTFEGSKPATPKLAEETISFIKETISKEYSVEVPILYGGSTDSDNVLSFVENDSISGVLVGGSSLDEEEFSKMIDIVNKLA